MKYFLALVLVLGIFFYLNRSYAFFYNFQGAHFISNPIYPEKTKLSSNNSKENLKLVVLGDSLMAGTGSSSQENSLGFKIAKNISQKQNVTLINLAYPGVGVEDVLVRQVPKAIEEKPDRVILMIGTNDVHNRVSVQIFKDKYGQVLDLLAKTNPKITIINIPYLGSKDILLPPWNSVMDWRIEEFNNQIKQLAESRSLKVVDLHSLKHEFKSADLYSIDQFHPSDKGYALWADYTNGNLNY